MHIESGELWFGVRLTHDPLAGSLELVPDVTLDPDADYRIVIEGLVGLEGGVLERTELAFRTSRIISDTPVDEVGWEEVEPLFERCARCHAGPEAPLGLDLSSPDAIRATAIGIEAAEARTGDRVSPIQPGLLGLARLTPGSPELSFLVWKLTGEPTVPGDPMPRDEPLPPGGPELISRWVAGGAPMP